MTKTDRITGFDEEIDFDLFDLEYMDRDELVTFLFALRDTWNELKPYLI